MLITTDYWNDLRIKVAYVQLSDQDATFTNLLHTVCERVCMYVYTNSTYKQTIV